MGGGAKLVQKLEGHRDRVSVYLYNLVVSALSFVVPRHVDPHSPHGVLLYRYCVNFHPTLPVLATASADKTIKLWVSSTQ